MSSIYTVSSDVTIPVLLNSLLFMRSIHLDILNNEGQVSPKIYIGLDLYTVLRSALVIDITGLTIMMPVHAEQ